MSNAREIIDTIENLFYFAEGYTKDDLFESLISIKDKIAKTDKKLADEMSAVIEEKLLDDDMCPHCMSPLSSKSIPLNTTEAYGSPVTEEGSIRYCSTCFWVED